MFLAIINDTYGTVKSEVNQGHSNFGSYLAKLFQKLYFCRQKDNEDIPKNASSHPQNAEIEEPLESYPKHSSSASLYPATNASTASEADRLRIRVSELIRE